MYYKYYQRPDESLADFISGIRMASALLRQDLRSSKLLNVTLARLAAATPPSDLDDLINLPLIDSGSVTSPSSIRGSLDPSVTISRRITTTWKLIIKFFFVSD